MNCLCRDMIRSECEEKSYVIVNCVICRLDDVFSNLCSVKLRSSII